MSVIVLGSSKSESGSEFDETLVSSAENREEGDSALSAEGISILRCVRLKDGGFRAKICCTGVHSRIRFLDDCVSGVSSSSV